MKKIKTVFKSGIAAMLALIMAFAVVGCGKSGGSEGPDEPEVSAVTVTIGSVASTNVKKGDTVQLTATVTGTENTAVTWSVSDTNLASVSASGLFTVLADTQYDRSVQVTATSVADGKAKDSVTFRILAPTQDGQVGLLTGDLIAAIGGENITFTGVLTDVYVDFNASYNNSNRKYNMTVKMEDGKWYGAWQNDPDDPTSGEAEWTADLYLRGTEDVKNSNGITGKALQTSYVDKNNTVVTKNVTDYQSIPAVWEEQHYFNHLRQLNVNKFTQLDADDYTRYVYYVDQSDEDSMYLMTYLAYSLTPLLEDTFDRIVLVLDEEGTKIEKILGQTMTTYYGADTQEDASAMFYTTVELTVSNVGTTEVPALAPYGAPEHADALSAAIAKMQTAKNYTYKLTDTMTSRPSTEGEYELSSASGAASAYSATVFEGETGEYPAIKNGTSAVGTPGQMGWVTEQGILFAKTTEYTASMDDQKYRIEYTGYKPGEGSYEEFEYKSTLKVFQGTKRVKGDMFDAMPKFDFSANVFEFVGVDSKGNYVFQLRDGAITRDVAMEISAYSYADDAEASSSNPLRITVSAAGQLVSTRFPYSINYSTYVGYCTTTFSAFGSTEIVENANFKVFAGYVPRGAMDSWDEYDVRYYHPDHNSNGAATEITADALFEIIFDGCTVPAPTVFQEVFGDNLHGPFFDWINLTDENGAPCYADYVDLTTSVPASACDENNKILDYDYWWNKIRTAMTAAGFTESAANTDLTGGPTGKSDLDLSFVGHGLIIRFNNNHTGNFWISIYKQGDWTLKRS